MENKYGVYQIVCKTTEHRYIGSTTGSFKYRWIDHKSLLRAGTHHSQHLQNAWNKYGEEDFLFLILDVMEDKEKCLEREQYYFDSIDHKTLYNIRFKVAWHPKAGEPRNTDYSRQSAGNTGRKASEESRKRMSESAKKRPYDDAMRDKLIRARSMIPPHSEATRKKMSESSKGQRHSAETIQKIADKNRGSHRTDEVREKMKKAQSNRAPISEETREKLRKPRGPRTTPISEETRNKLSEAGKRRKGIKLPPLSPEHKRKISEAGKGRVQSEDAKKRISESNAGRKRTDDEKKKMSESQKGKKLSPESIAKREATKKRNRELNKLNAD